MTLSFKVFGNYTYANPGSIFIPLGVSPKGMKMDPGLREGVTDVREGVTDVISSLRGSDRFICDIR